MNRVGLRVVVLVMGLAIISGCGQKKDSDQVVMWLVGSEAQGKDVKARLTVYTESLVSLLKGQQEILHRPELAASLALAQ